MATVLVPLTSVSGTERTTMATVNKSPYEIRLELLQMAKDQLDAQFQLQLEFAKKVFDAALAANQVTLDTWKTFVPAGYTIDDITKKATELYGFVSKK
jgi:hypothetical protein